MKHYFFIRIKTPKKTQLLLKLNRLNVDIKNIVYEKDGLSFSILSSDLKKVRKYLVSYEIEVIDETGIYKIKKELKKNNLIITGIVFAVVIFLILSNLIVKINVIHEDAGLRELIMDSLKEAGVTTLSFKKSYQEYEEIIENIKDKYPDKIEWLEIDVQGMVLNVRVEERIIKEYQKDSSTCHIVASKSGIIKSIYTEKGVSLVSINDYVTKGEILISGAIALNEEVKENVCASGKVYAEVWYDVDASVPLMEKRSKDTGKMRYNFMVKKGSNETVLLKSRVSDEKRVENVLLFKLFGLEFYLQKEYEVEIEEYTYTEEEALKKARDLVLEKLSLKLDDFEDIIEEKVLQKTVKNNKLYIDMFASVKEQIGVQEYFEVSRSDIDGKEYNEYPNRIN